MATLKPPFRAEDMDGLYKKVVKGSYQKIGDNYSKALSSAIKSMLQVNPANRHLPVSYSSICRVKLNNMELLYHQIPLNQRTNNCYKLSEQIKIYITLQTGFQSQTMQMDTNMRKSRN